MIEILNSTTLSKHSKPIEIGGVSHGYGGTGIVVNDIYYRYGGYAGGELNHLTKVDLTQNICETLASFKRSLYGVGFEHNGKLYFYGGWVDGVWRACNVLNVYDIATNSWTTSVPVNGNPPSESNCVKINNRVYFVPFNNSTLNYIDLTDMSFHATNVVLTSNNRSIGNGVRIAYHRGKLHISSGNGAAPMRWRVDLMTGEIVQKDWPLRRYAGLVFVDKQDILYYHSGADFGLGASVPILQKYNPDSNEMLVVENKELFVKPFVETLWSADAVNDKYAVASGGFNLSGTKVLAIKL